MEDNGRAAIVLPDNVLFEDKATELWQYLMTRSNIHTIMRLPNGTFAPYAPGVKANVIFLQKGSPTKQVWVFDARTDIEGITKKGRPLLDGHFKEFEVCYGNDPNGNSKRIDQGVKGRFRKFSLAEITKRNYNLDITWSKELTNAQKSTDQTPEIALEIAIDKLQHMVKDLKGILQSLNK